MSNIEKLKKLLTEEFIPELEEALAELANINQSWKATTEDKEEFEELKEMKNFFDNILIDLNANDLTQDEAQEIIQAVEEMRLK